MAQSLAVPPDVRIARLTVEQYHAMIERGILKNGDPVELLQGLLVPKMTKNTPHIVAGKLLSQEIARVVPEGFHVQIQDPVTTPDSEPEPDLAVVRGAPRDYLEHKPRAADVPLVVEIADDSLERDRGTKLAIYARAGVAVYLIVNLRDRRIELYQEPSGDAYARREERGPGAKVNVILDGASVGEIEVDTILP